MFPPLFCYSNGYALPHTRHTDPQSAKGKRDIPLAPFSKGDLGKRDITFSSCSSYGVRSRVKPVTPITPSLQVARILIVFRAFAGLQGT